MGMLPCPNAVHHQMSALSFKVGIWQRTLCAAIGQCSSSAVRSSHPTPQSELLHIAFHERSQSRTDSGEAYPHHRESDESYALHIPSGARDSVFARIETEQKGSVRSAARSPCGRFVEVCVVPTGECRKTGFISSQKPLELETIAKPGSSSQASVNSALPRESESQTGA